MNFIPIFIDILCLIFCSSQGFYECFDAFYFDFGN